MELQDTEYKIRKLKQKNKIKVMRKEPYIIQKIKIKIPIRVE